MRSSEASAVYKRQGQALVKWQPGSVVLPLPDNGQQIQWGSNVQQLGRGANKLSLDGGTGNANIPGFLSVGNGTGRITAGTSGNTGQICGVSTDHAILLRGDTTSTDINYAITSGDTCCFIEYGGRWVFRMINPGLNVNLFEINTGNVFYKNVALERIPWISALVQVSGAVVNNRGQRVATCPKGRLLSTSYASDHHTPFDLRARHIRDAYHIPNTIRSRHNKHNNKT